MTKKTKSMLHQAYDRIEENRPQAAANLAVLMTFEINQKPQGSRTIADREQAMREFQAALAAKKLNFKGLGRD